MTQGRSYTRRWHSPLTASPWRLAHPRGIPKTVRSTFGALTANSSPTIIRDAHRGRLVNLAFAPGGKVISCGWGARRVRDPQGNMPDELSMPQIRIWDARSGRKLKDLDPGVTEGISGLALSRDGKTLVSAHHDRLLVWDLPAKRSAGPSRSVLQRHR